MLKTSAIALLLIGGPVHADACDTQIRDSALEVSLRRTTSNEAFQQALNDMDGFVSQCPNHPWINALGAEFDMRVYRALVGANNQINQQAINFLLRAFARSEIYMAVPVEQRRDVQRIQTASGSGDLTYTAASGNRREILDTLMLLARLGSVHPYLAGEPSLTCGGWSTPDVHTVTSAMQNEEDLIFQTFTDAMAEACRGEEDMTHRNPLATVSKTYVHLVDMGRVTDQAKARELLLKARDYRDAYLQGQDESLFLVYSQFDSDRLDRLLRARGVDAMAGRLPRELWFTPEHVQSRKVQFSIAWAISEEWASIRRQVIRGEIALSTGYAELSRFVFAVLAEGREAGLVEETRAVLRAALSDFQESRVLALSVFEDDNFEMPSRGITETLIRSLATPQMEGD